MLGIHSPYTREETEAATTCKRKNSGKSEYSHYSGNFLGFKRFMEKLCTQVGNKTRRNGKVFSLVQCFSAVIQLFFFLLFCVISGRQDQEIVEVFPAVSKFLKIGGFLLKK